MFSKLVGERVGTVVGIVGDSVWVDEPINYDTLVASSIAIIPGVFGVLVGAYVALGAVDGVCGYELEK